MQPPKPTTLPATALPPQPASSQSLDRRMGLVAEISHLEWQAWRHHPVSQVLLRYLEDYRAALERDFLAAWLQGSTNAAAEGERRGRILACMDIEQLTVASVKGFYGLPADDAG